MNFLQKIARDADSFADGLTLTMLAFVLTAFVWTVLHHLNVVGPPAAMLISFARWLFIGWMVFRGVCAIIDYTLFAVAKTYAFLAVATLKELNSSVDPVFGADLQIEAKEPGTLTYLQDFLARSHRRPDDVTGAQ